MSEELLRNDRDNYLNLLRDALCFAIYKEPLKPLHRTKKGIWQSFWLWLDKQVRKTGYAFAIQPRLEINYWPVCAHTMVSKARLDNIRELCEFVVKNEIPGSFVECGVWRGGASIFARACLPLERKVICCDSFCGLPKDPHEPMYEAMDFLKVSEKEVQENFEKYGLWQNVEFVKGFFEYSLAGVKPPIAILRADADMRSSTLQILYNLYHRVTPGGFVIIDDWCLPKCRLAVEEFRSKLNITAPLIDIDGQAVFWKKPFAL